MKLKLFLALLMALTLASGVVSALDQEQPTQPLPVAQSDKLDAECTGLETAGRCIDKPVQESIVVVEIPAEARFGK